MILHLILGILAGLAAGALAVFLQQVFEKKSEEIAKLQKDLRQLRKRNERLRTDVSLKASYGAAFTITSIEEDDK